MQQNKYITPEAKEVLQATKDNLNKAKDSTLNAIIYLAISTINITHFCKLTVKQAINIHKDN